MAILIFACLWLVDTFATARFVHVWGLEAEANPMMRYLIAHTGLTGFVLVKLSILLLWWRLYRKAPRWTTPALCVVMFPVAVLALATSLPSIPFLENL